MKARSSLQVIAAVCLVGLSHILYDTFAFLLYSSLR
jgi:hypothetical protein